jgi:hypothetical protein
MPGKAEATFRKSAFTLKPAFALVSMKRMLCSFALALPSSMGTVLDRREQIAGWTRENRKVHASEQDRQRQKNSNRRTHAHTTHILSPTQHAPPTNNTLHTTCVRRHTHTGMHSSDSRQTYTRDTGETEQGDRDTGTDTQTNTKTARHTSHIDRQRTDRQLSSRKYTPLGGQIGFVADQHQNDVFAPLCANVFNPLIGVLERGTICSVRLWKRCAQVCE